MSLSSLIVQREVASIRQVEEALARQVLYGGDLVTNLMEVVQLPESVLVPLLAESVGMTAAPIGMLPAPSAEARALVPEDVAARRVVMPLSVDGDRLVLAVSEPLARDDLDELSFALGVRIEERIAPSVRIREALARSYGLPLERRMARLVGRLAGVDPSVPNSLPPVAGPKRTIPPLPAALIHDIPKLNPPGMPLLGTLRFPDARAGDDRPPPPSVSAPPMHGPFTRTQSSADLKAVLPTLMRESKAAPEVTRRRGPVTLERVTAELAEIKDREALLALFFDFARQFFEYGALFVVHGDLAEGRDAFGNGASRDRVLALGVPLDMPSILQAVRERGVPVCAVPQTGGVDSVLMADLKRDPRSKVLAVPIVVRSRVVAFFVADDGPRGIDAAAQAEVVTVATLVGREFERLIVRQKLHGFSSDVRPAEPERRIDPRRVMAKPRRTSAEVREAGVQALEQAVTGSIAPPPLPAEPTVASPSPLPAPTAAATQPSSRPGALRPDALAPRAAPVSPVPRAYQTLRNFPAPLLEAIEDATEDPPVVAAADDSLTDPEPVMMLSGGLDGDLAPVSERARALAGDLTPPPPQTVAVRRPSGRPIPREEVDADGAPVSSTRFEHISSRPPPADLRQARLLREIDALTAQFSHSPPSSKGPPSARPGQAVTLAPHLPPTSRTHEPLPSVIVDEGVRVERLVEAFIANPKDDQSEAELLRLGQQAMPSIMKHFPGPITITRATLDDSWPRVSECGPILRLIAGQRRVALPFVLARSEDNDTEIRFWATYLMTELAYAEAIPAVVARLFDDSKRVRRAARLVAHVVSETAAAALVAELDRIVRDPKASSARRVVTLDALGELRDRLVIPVLLAPLSDEDEEVGLAARKALLLVSRQDFGRDMKKWLTWWQANAARHRIEWLIDALTHEIPAHRRAAGQELKALTEQYFGYYDDLPKKDREKVQQKYREWWKTEGQARFRKG